MLEVFRKAPLLDASDVYQHLMDYWSETMQDDVYVLVQDGWTATLESPFSVRAEPVEAISSLHPEARRDKTRALKQE